MTASCLDHRRSKRTIIICAAISAAVVIAILVIDGRTRPVLTYGPMVQIPEPGCVVLVWGAKTFLDGGELRTTIAGRDPARATLRSDGIYEAAFKELSAGEELTYTVFNRTILGRWAPVAGPFSVVVPPARGKPFRFLAFGDSGVGSNAQFALAELMAKQKPDLIIHAGDLDQANGEMNHYQTIFLEPYADMIRSIPFMPVLGNHDCVTGHGAALLETFVLPRNGPPGVEPERYYWFDFGDARFVGLDGNKAHDEQGGVLTAEQMKIVVAPWLRDVLTRCDARWKFVWFHQPIYTGSEHPASGSAYLKDAYANVFDECGVDMVFSGHNHLYERTAPIKNDQIVEDGRGTVYITTGAGGARRYPESLPPPDYIRVYNDQTLSFTQIDLSGDRLELRQIGSRGDVLDEYTITKSQAPSQTAAPALP